MKQHITIEQLNELSHANKEKLLGWLVSKNYAVLEDDNNWTFTTPTIGQMIEFLCDKWKSKIILSPNTKGGWIVAWDFAKPKQKEKYCQSKELCDALWEVVKNVLESE